MTLAYEIVKNRKIHSMEADRTVLEAARFMTEHNIGALPILKNGQLAGIFSERDIMTRVVGAGRAPGTTRLAEVMTPNPKSVDPTETIEDCMFLLREFGFRHLLITDGEELKGLLSLRDILLAYAAEKEGGAERMAV